MRNDPLWPDPLARAQGFKALFAGPLGEKVLEDLKRTAGYFYRPTFDPNPQIAAFNEGQRAVVLAITNTIALADNPPAVEEPEEQDA